MESPKQKPRSYGRRKSRRLPDTYNAEVVRASRGSSGIVNLEQFEFLKEAEVVRVGGERRGR